MDSDELCTDAAAIIRAARTGVHIGTPPTVPDHVIVVVDGQALRIISLEEYLPAPTRRRGTAILHAPADFGRYVLTEHNRNSGGGTTVFADERRGQITAVFNEWRDHTAVLGLTPDSLWTHWVSASGKEMNQVDFARHIQEGSPSIVEPPAAVMAQIAMTFRAKRNIQYHHATRLDTNDLELTYDQTTSTSAGRPGAPITVPMEITLALAPWRGVPAVPMQAQLQWQIRSDKSLGMGFYLLRVDDAREAAFSMITEELREQLGDAAGIPVYDGFPPRPVEPTESH